MITTLWEKGEGNTVESIAYGFEVSIIRDNTDNTYTVSIQRPKKRVQLEKGFKTFEEAKTFAQNWVNRELGVKKELNND